MSSESIDFYALVHRRGKRVHVLEWVPTEIHIHKERDRDRNTKIADWANDLDDELEGYRAALPDGLSAVLVTMWASSPSYGCEDYDNGLRLQAVTPLADPDWHRARDVLRTAHQEGLYAQEQWYKRENERLAPEYDAKVAEMNAQLAATPPANKVEPS